jgi:hypothetical protein
MNDRLVFVPCALPRGESGPAVIEDADGWPTEVCSPLGRVRGKLCVAARWVRAAGGRPRVFLPWGVVVVDSFRTGFR